MLTLKHKISSIFLLSLRLSFYPFISLFSVHPCKFCNKNNNVNWVSLALITPTLHMHQLWLPNQDNFNCSLSILHFEWVIISVCFFLRSELFCRLVHLYIWHKSTPPPSSPVKTDFSKQSHGGTRNNFISISLLFDFLCSVRPFVRVSVCCYFGLVPTTLLNSLSSMWPHEG